MSKLRQISYLVTFFIRNYYRATHVLLEVISLALYAGIIFDHRWAPYTYENIIIGKSVFLVLTGVLISFRLSRNQYTSQFSVILSRVSRKGIFLASILSCMVLTTALGFLLDLYFLIAIRASWSTLFGLPTLVVSFCILLLTVTVVHAGSIYVVPDQFLRVLLPLFLLLGAIPNWYTTLPLENVWKVVSYVLPPLAQGIGSLSKGAFTYLSIWHPLLYSIVVVWLGIRLFEKRSLTDLY